MVYRFSTLDYAPLFAAGVPAMVTLTLAAGWLDVAPTGQAYKALFEAWVRRLKRAWGPEYAFLIWKLEFQRRGALYLYLFMVILVCKRDCFCELCDLGYPRRLGYGTALAFPEWLLHSWADVVQHPDLEDRRRHLLAGIGIDYRQGLDSRDLKRLAVYFGQGGGAAGGKEY
jgi:hypothetical protein